MSYCACIVKTASDGSPSHIEYCDLHRNAERMLELISMAAEYPSRLPYQIVEQMRGVISAINRRESGGNHA